MAAANKPTNAARNADRYLEGREGASARYASFDHCFNYFRSHYETGSTDRLADTGSMQLSCLHLGFYLASWGMFRGKAALLQHSAARLAPVIETIATAPAVAWEADVEGYTDPTINELIEIGRTLRDVLPGGQSDTLVTKTMLGVFGCVPAFDRFFRRGLPTSGFRPKALRTIRDYYADNAAAIDDRRVPTLDFDGTPTNRRYTQAKVIDMIFFIEGGGPT